MNTHQEIDRRALRLARAVVERIDADSRHSGFEHARDVCARWMKNTPSPATAEWWALLQHSWGDVRTALLMETEEGNRLRQNTPFCGILTPRERWALLKKERTADVTKAA